MSVKLRQELERRIAEAVIDGALQAGYTLGVNDGEETTLERSKDKAKVLAAMFTTDDDWLLVYDASGDQIGWVRFVYGNNGWDVVNDNTLNLEPIMTAANELADKYSD